MAEVSGRFLTAKGRALLAKTISEEKNSTTYFTRFAAGDGDYSRINMNNISEMVNEKKTFSITHKGIVNKTTSLIKGLLTNEDLQEGFFVTAIGLFAEDPDEGEILHTIVTFDKADYLPAAQGPHLSTAGYNIYVDVADSSNVHINVTYEGVASAEDLEEHVNDSQIHVTEAEKDSWNSKAGNEDLQTHVDSYISDEEGVHGIKVQEGKLMYLSEGTWIENDTGKDEMLDKLDSLTEAMGKPNPTDKNKENIMNFLNLLYARENDKSDFILAQTLTSMLSVGSLEWAIAEMNRTGRFGLILRKAFNLDANILDNLVSLYDVVNNPNVVTIILGDSYCNAMIHSCPTFLNAIENGSTYIDFMTGTPEGIQQLKSSYDSMNYVINSEVWIDAFVRNSSVSYQILEDSRWRIRFYSIPNESTSERLFDSLEWYQYTDTNMSAWEDLASATSSLNQMPFKKFIESYDKYISVLNHNEKLYPILNNKGAASVMFSEPNILTYGNDIIDSTNYIHIYNSFSTLNILFDNGLGTAMLSSRKWCALLVGVSASSTALSQKPDFVAFAKDKPIFIQEMSKIDNNGAFSNAVFTNHTSSIISILKNGAYFESFSRTLESDIDSDATIYYTPNSNGFLLINNVSRTQRKVGSEGAGTVALRFIVQVPLYTSQTRGLTPNKVKTSTTGAEIAFNGSGGGTTSYPVEVLNAGEIRVRRLSDEISEKNFVRMSVKYDFTEYISKA